MKKLIGLIFLIMVLFSIAASVFASEFSVTTFQRTRDADQDKYSVGSWYGVQVSYAPEDKFYFLASQETAEVAPKGHAFDYNMTGVGMGMKFHPIDDVVIFGQISYLFINNTLGKQPYSYNEALEYFLNSEWNATATSQKFDGYQVENENAFAGTFGVELNHKFTKSLTGSLMFSKRIMSIKEVIRGFNDAWDYEHTGVCLELGLKRSYTSTNMGLSLNYTF